MITLYEFTQFISLKIIYLFIIFLFLATLSLCCYKGTFSSYRERGYCLFVVCVCVCVCVLVCVCAKLLQLCLTLCNPMDCSLLGSSVHGILQARILEQAAISFSRVSSWPRDRTHISYASCITTGATWESLASLVAEHRH